MDIVKTTLTDGTPYEFDADLCHQEAHTVLDGLWEQEDVTHHFDFVCTIHALLTNCITILSNNGWTEEELMQSVIEYSSNNDSGGRH